VVSEWVAVKKGVHHSAGGYLSSKKYNFLSDLFPRVSASHLIFSDPGYFLPMCGFLLLFYTELLRLVFNEHIKV